ncbi:DUF917 domain-containing protein [Biostraticola tofi]|uniref:DUF917 domain-containing protein n=1 Tax=Biostraticola tofi TaxID=466109 RepID=A0A4R3YR70_9GAMM|nr:DUF917 domain-containing protein [Biostraticola tofi]TCV95445.1 hypothetical protein EDC52_10547 [Biostraticola tofi]
MRYLDEMKVELIAIGASILASGGGGDPHIGRIMAINAIRKYGPIPLYSVEELDPQDLLVSTGMIGSPTIMMEKIPNGNESTIACRLMEKRLNRKINAIYPIEAGGINSLLPLATACQLGLPVADVDGMGRAFPEFHMTTFHLDDIDASPFAIVDEKFNQVVIQSKDSHKTEKFARSITVQMGGAAIFAAYPLSPAQAQQSGILGTLSLMQMIGEQVEQARRDKTSIVDTLVSLLYGQVLFRGRINRLDQRSDDGFTRGSVSFEGVDSCEGKSYRVQFQNEFLLAECAERMLCCTPDLIILLDEDTGTPLLSERLRYGIRTVAIGIPAHAKWRTPRGIAIAGPQYFGYASDFKPLESLNAAEKER